MNIFIDSANLEEIKTAAAWCFIDGVTTNPSLVAKEGGSLAEIAKTICTYIDGPISVEALNTTTDEIIKEGMEISQWHKNIVIKVPCTLYGIAAAKELEKRGVKTNVTLVFSPNQVLLAAKAGASFISPFVGRLDDAGHDGLGMIAESLEILRAYNFPSKIIVASIRSPLTVQRAAQMGAHIATVPYKILIQLVSHPLTDAGVQKFLKDWASKK